MDFHSAAAGKIPVAPQDANPNDNDHLSIQGMIETLFINLFSFIVLMLIFESNRFYKQIYLKRLQNRFRVSYSLLTSYLSAINYKSNLSIIYEI
jgi:hypothetical protein